MDERTVRLRASVSNDSIMTVEDARGKKTGELVDGVRVRKAAQGEAAQVIVMRLIAATLAAKRKSALAAKTGKELATLDEKKALRAVLRKEVLESLEKLAADRARSSASAATAPAAASGDGD